MAGVNFDVNGQSGYPSPQTLRADAGIVNSLQKLFLHGCIIWVWMLAADLSEQSTFGKMCHFVKQAADADTDYTNWAGYETFSYGWVTTPGTTNCVLYWDTSGTPWERRPCADCDYAFDITSTYNAAMTVDDGTCTSMATDFSFGYGVAFDYASAYGTGDWLFYYSADSHNWGLFAEIVWNSASGELSYSAGIEDLDLTDYNYPGYYYTSLWAGEATLSE